VDTGLPIHSDAVRPGGLVVVIPAKDEAERITATVRAARQIEGVAVVVVVDDGSADDTAALARKAGAEVVEHGGNRGKGAAMESGAARVAALDRSSGLDHPRAMLFIDADLGDSAAAAGVLAEPVLADEADMTIAIIPKQATEGGGSGRVVRLSRTGIRSLTGWTATQPLSGTRCLNRSAFDQARPLAAGWGVETGLTIDLVSAGYRVVEVPAELHHRVTGTDRAGQLHRAGQYRDVYLALLERRIRPRHPRVAAAAARVTRLARAVLGSTRLARSVLGGRGRERRP
jgi:glycosyltransferase involved in cell wall biosynthesis